MPPEEKGEKSTPPEADQAPLKISPEQEAAFRAISELIEIPLESFATVRRFEAAEDLLSYLHAYPLNDQKWAFRGHASAAWRLEPSIERLQNSYSNSFRIDAEQYVRTAFKRRAHHYLQYLPS